MRWQEKRFLEMDKGVGIKEEEEATLERVRVTRGRKGERKRSKGEREKEDCFIRGDGFG